MNKTRKKVLNVITKVKAEDAFESYAIAEMRAEELSAKLEQALIGVRQEYQEELHALEERKCKAVEILTAYAAANKSLFRSRKSFEMQYGVIGFRTGTHRLERSRDITWDEVKEKVTELLPSYIRIKTEINKESLIAERENLEVSGLFEKCGMEVLQDEIFYIQTKKERAG